MEGFAAEIGDAIPVDLAGDIASAVARAAAEAKPGDLVLLSPACASFDQYKDFEQRGDAFRAAVQALGACWTLNTVRIERSRDDHSPYIHRKRVVEGKRGLVHVDFGWGCIFKI